MKVRVDVGGEEGRYEVEAYLCRCRRQRMKQEGLAIDALGVGRWRIEREVFGIDVLHEEYGGGRGLIVCQFLTDDQAYLQ